MLKKNQKVIIEVTGITNEGSGVGRHEGIAIFVPMTAIGDIVEVKVTKVLKSYAFGIIDKLITPSFDRIENDCSVFTRCGGCAFRHISYEAELGIKHNIVADAFKRIGKINPELEPILGCEQTEGYRNKAQYPVAIYNDEVAYGFYAKRSHRIVPQDHCGCKLQPSEFQQVAQDIIAYIAKNGIAVYDELSHKGILRNIYLRMAHNTKQMQVCLVVTKAHKELFLELASTLMSKYELIKSVVLNINSEKTNVILGNKCITLQGEDTITDVMCGNEIELLPLSFYQVNTPQAERLYRIAAEYAQLTGAETLLDLYCGVGTIGLSLADKAAKVIGVEVISEAVENAINNAKRNGIDNTRFICADAANAAQMLVSEGATPDVVVLDPPRKGCDEQTLQAVAEMAPKRVIMISCNPATAARDCARLEELGYKVVKARAVDMFPRTTHVETVVLMSRNI